MGRINSKTFDKMLPLEVRISSSDAWGGTKLRHCELRTGSALTRSIYVGAMTEQCLNPHSLNLITQSIGGCDISTSLAYSGFRRYRESTMSPILDIFDILFAEGGIGDAAICFNQ